jgi:hypothetical protein
MSVSLKMLGRFMVVLPIGGGVDRETGRGHLESS